MRDGLAFRFAWCGARRCDAQAPPFHCLNSGTSDVSGPPSITAQYALLLSATAPSEAPPVQGHPLAPYLLVGWGAGHHVLRDLHWSTYRCQWRAVPSVPLAQSDRRAAPSAMGSVISNGAGHAEQAAPSPGAFSTAAPAILGSGDLASRLVRPRFQGSFTPFSALLFEPPSSWSLERGKCA
ncbi:hypothetical protein NDU88_005777 [Pleurodeles waltl]|uniref:Uncharacterized protein n=1 Tax=Pleurodeles waltl TaxID=8319 RepID=A0AAV7SML0_PLEWA|nr:hypothetical protein NDU88_005777 [Pleurodeles waltl]